jgi:hypothetical protein
MVLAASSPPLSRLLLRALGNQRRFLRVLSLRLLSAIAAYLAHSTAIVGRLLLSRLLSCASLSADIAAPSLCTLLAITAVSSRAFYREFLSAAALLARSGDAALLAHSLAFGDYCHSSRAFYWGALFASAIAAALLLRL